MKIYSAFKDYYDIYHSDEPVYHRKTEFVPCSISIKCDCRVEDLMYLKGFMGFCGTIYPAFNVTTKGGYALCFTVDQLDKLIKEEYPAKYDSKLGFTSAKRWRFGKDSWQDISRKEAEEIVQASKVLVPLFEKHQTPIFFYHYRNEGNNLELNPQLNKWGFQKTVPPYEAYQQVSMFLGNMVAPRKPIPKISDEIMAEIKGFNRFSFRKDKSVK